MDRKVQVLTDETEKCEEEKGGGRRERRTM